jgi:Predicted membrane protein (DUF2339)
VYDAEHGERHVELTRRVTELEKRVAELEAAARATTAQTSQPAPEQPSPTAASPLPAGAPWPPMPQYSGVNQPYHPPAAQQRWVPPAWSGQVQVPPPPPYAQPWMAPPTRRPPAQTRPVSEELGISLGSLRDLESRLTGKLLAWVGATAVVLGAVFFLSLAFSRGWIGPEGRVAIGLVGGAVFMGLGTWLLGRRQDQLGHVVIAVGLGVVSLALFAGTRLYGLFPPETALAGSFVAALIAAAIAVRHDSETVAIFGLIAIIAAPPVLGASASLVTVLFLGVAIVGTTSISLLRSWRWLPPVAWALSAPQVLLWVLTVQRSEAVLAIAVLGGYWLLHALAAAADELKAEQAKIEGRAEMLFSLNSIVAVAGGLCVAAVYFPAWEGTFVAGAALAHFAFGAYFIWRRGDKYPFGMLANGIGIGLVAFAIERQFDGPAVALGWALEALVLVVIYRVRRHVPAGAAALALAALPLAHLVWYEYQLGYWALNGTTHVNAAPFVNPAGLTLAGLLAMGLAAAWISRHHSARCAVVTAALLMVAYALPYELSGVALLAAWSVLVPASVAAEALLDRLPGVPEKRTALRIRPVIEMMEANWPDAPLVAAAGAAALALGHFLAFDAPIANLSAVVLPVSPFSDLLTVSGLIGIAAFLAAARLTARPDLRVAGVLIAAALAAYTAVFELATPYAVVVWCGLAIPVAAGVWFHAYGRPGYLAGAATLVGAGVVAVLALVVPVERLGIEPFVTRVGLWFAIDAVLAIGAIAAVLAIGADLLPIPKAARQTLALAAAGAIVYLLSALLVDWFQGGLGGSTPLEELQKQAQVSVSILWGLIGMAVFVAGIVGWRQLVREAGLALLGLATAKVFLFDLSYLDVSYRVLSLMALGVFLLVGAYIYQLRKPSHPAPGEGATGGQA